MADEIQYQTCTMLQSIYIYSFKYERGCYNLMINMTRSQNIGFNFQLLLYGISIIEHVKKIASEMPVPHSLGKYFQHHEIQKYCISTNFRILSEHCQFF